LFSSLDDSVVFGAITLEGGLGAARSKLKVEF
jgi:hypothetical protein